MLFAFYRYYIKNIYVYLHTYCTKMIAYEHLFAKGTDIVQREIWLKLYKKTKKQ